MGSLTTSTDICRACGKARKPGADRCAHCGAGREPVAEGSGLELDARALEHVRAQREAREREREETDALAESEAPTRELVAEEPPSRLQPTTLIGLSQVTAGLASVLLLAQGLWSADFPDLTRLFLEVVAGRSVPAAHWVVAGLPWLATAGTLGLALGAAQRALGRPLVRSVAGAALLATLPLVLLRGWPALHGHLGAALVRRGGRRRASLLVGWSQGALVLLAVAVGLVLLSGLGLVPVPPGVLAIAGVLAVAARQGHLAALCLTLPGVLQRPTQHGTPLPSRLVCPDCGVDGPTLQRFREGLAGSACPQCAGALLGPGQVTTLLALAHVEDAAYKREVRLGTVGGRLVSCPQCGSAMRGIRLRTVIGHGCPACGSLWLDRMGLARLSGGRSFAGPAPQRLEAPLGTGWPALTTMVALILLMLPWVAVRTGLCEAGSGICTSVPASPWGRESPP
jgi:Zn-finger nucleic acid-binding protein